MRVLFISSFGCLPATCGNRARILAHLDEAERLGHEVWFYGLGLSPEDAGPLAARFGERFRLSQYVLTRDARPLGRKLRRSALALAVRSGAVEPPIDYWFQPQWLDEIEDLAKEIKFDVAVAEYVFMSQALLGFGRETLKIIDTHDCFSARSQSLKSAGFDNSWQRAGRKEEAKGLRRADLVLAIQDFEAKLFREILGGGGRVLTVGHWVECERVWSPDFTTQRIGILASDNSINLEGIQWFIQCVLPEILRSCPDAKLCIGGGICNSVRAGPGIELAGIVREVGSFYAGCAVVINPVRIGSGLKIKTIEAMGRGMPVVTTHEGASGLEMEAGKSFALAEDAATFARTVSDLLVSPAAAQKLSDSALSFVEGWNTRCRTAFAEAIGWKGK